MTKIKFIEPNIDLIKEYKTYCDLMSDENTFILMNGEKYNLEITSEIIKNLQDKAFFPFAKWAISNKKIVGQIFLRTFSTERSRGVHKLTMLLHVLPEYRGQKIASELLSQAKQKANAALSAQALADMAECRAALREGVGPCRSFHAQARPSTSPMPYKPQRWLAKKCAARRLPSA